MIIPHPSTWDESSLHLIPVFAEELRDKTAALVSGPSDDVPLHDTSTRVVWLTAAIAKLRQIEHRRSERLAARAAQNAEKILLSALAHLREKRTLKECGNGEL